MTLRSDALAWLRATGRASHEPVRVSKLYSPEQSWTDAPAWWFEFPENLVTSQAHSHVSLLCESEVGSQDFTTYESQFPSLPSGGLRLGLGSRRRNTHSSSLRNQTPSFMKFGGLGKSTLQSLKLKQREIGVRNEY